MYSYEERLKTVQLYTKYDHSIADAIRGLEYPSMGMLLRWYKEYQENGDLHRVYERDPSFTLEEKKTVLAQWTAETNCLSQASPSNNQYFPDSVTPCGFLFLLERSKSELEF